MADRPPGELVEPAPQSPPRAGWGDIGATAYASALLVGLFLAVGVYLVATAINPAADDVRVWWGAAFIGVGAFGAVTGIILPLRQALMSEPPPRTRSAGKVEV
jgi:hypothetical protein